MTLPEVPVLIVGGGTVGLSMAVFLSRQGVPSLLLERHASTSIHPRVAGPGVRTMELFRLAGLEEEILRAAPPVRGSGAIRVETLAAADLPHLASAPSTQAESTGGLDQFSPSNHINCPQDLIDPVLVDAARRGGASIRFNSEVVGIEQDAAGVTVAVRESGAQSTLRARFVVAADGSGSFIRHSLDIATTGPGALGAYIINVLFEADLSALVGEHPFVIAEVKNEQLHGMFIRIRDNHRWVLHISYDPAKGESTDDFTPERCRELIFAAIGKTDIDVEILGIIPWQVAGSVAECFQHGQVFLIGDASHVVPPTGGYGMNTGIADAHNLAWKLALVLRGQAGASLLDTYDDERRPVALFTMDQSLLRLRHAELHFDPTRVAERIERGIANPLVVHLGYRYASQAIIDPRASLPSLEDLDQDLDGSPGTRLPHAWLEYRSARLSTLDLADSRFTLLTGSHGEAWCAAAEPVAKQRGLDLHIFRIADGIVDLAGILLTTLGIEDDGAVLVRPDGFIAWRSMGHSGQPERVVERVFGQVLGKEIAAFD